MIHQNSLTAKVLGFVQTHPGLSTKDIATNLMPGASRKSVQRSLEYLRDYKAVENLGGGTGRPTMWYFIKPPKIKAKYRKMARDILLELQTIHHTKREDFLALKLQELLDK